MLNKGILKFDHNFALVDDKGKADYITARKYNK